MKFNSEQFLWQSSDFKNPTKKNHIYWLLKNMFHVELTILAYVVPLTSCNYLIISMDLLKMYSA